MLFKKLVQAGLTDKEAKVYLAILELGEASIVRIVQKSSIKRSTVYEMLDLLKQKGMIFSTKRGKKTLYLGESPQKLANKLEERKKTLEDVMPELMSYMNLIDNKPKIRYHEGIEGLREVFRDTLEYPNQEILSWFPYPYITLGDDFFEDYYFPERLKKKITMRAIIPDTEKNREFADYMNKKVITNTRFVAKKLTDLSIEIKIYGRNKFGIISHEEEIALIIESKKIYKSMKAIFESLWDLLPER